MPRMLRKLMGLDQERAPLVAPTTRLERYLMALIALVLLFILASSAHGWSALIQVTDLRESRDDSGKSWRTIHLGPFDTPLRVSATTGVEVGDYLELGVTCHGDECAMNVLGVRRPAQP